MSGKALEMPEKRCFINYLHIIRSFILKNIEKYSILMEKQELLWYNYFVQATIGNNKKSQKQVLFFKSKKSL
ncbi:MAG: hypothetical protein Q4E89_08990 [Eubacteriales bacterium]|nr:hypothetical protein [Eubacteriales bacterium]